MRFSDSILKRGEAEPPQKKMEGENRIKTIPTKPVDFFTPKNYTHPSLAEIIV